MFHGFVKKFRQVWKNKRAMGTTIFTSYMIIGIGIPMLAVGWDINNMRTYQTDMDNITQMALLSVTASSGNTYKGDYTGIIKGVVACNLNRENIMKGSELLRYFGQGKCAEYRVGKQHGDLKMDGDGTRRSSISGSLGKVQYRPGLTVTKVDVDKQGKSEIYAQTHFRYKPLFLQSVVENLDLGDENGIPVETSRSHVQARLLCIRDMDCSKSQDDHGNQK
jgi:hypothetical protein